MAANSNKAFTAHLLVSNLASPEPGDSVSDSWNRIFPGTSIASDEEEK